MGDVLAGVSSPLAFLWLLYAALAQRVELELQRKDLRQNNQTQILQQKELQRSADAMTAQTARIEAQAAAQYEPILLVKRPSDSSLRDNRLNIGIVNAGPPILNVTFSTNVTLNSLNVNGDYQYFEKVISHWPTDATLLISIPFGSPDERPQIAFAFQRLDTLRKAHVYRVMNCGNRIQLIDVFSDDASVDSALNV